MAMTTELALARRLTRLTLAFGAAVALATAAQACSVDATDANGDQLHAVIDNDATCPARSAETIDTYASLLLLRYSCSGPQRLRMQPEPLRRNRSPQPSCRRRNRRPRP